MSEITQVEEKAKKRTEQRLEKKKREDPKNHVVWATEEDFEQLKALAMSLVVDGDLSDDDLKIISEAIDRQEEKGRLSEKQLAELQNLISKTVAENDPTKVDGPLKAFAWLSLVGGALTVISLIVMVLVTIADGFNLAANYQGSSVEWLFGAVQGLLFAVGAVLHVVLGVRLLKGKRYGGAQMATALALVGVADVFLETMTTGISWAMASTVVVTVFRIALAVYLSPSLANERKLSDNIRMSDTKNRAENKILGLDLEGKGYIKLDFFNIFWVFVVACFLGVVVEVIWHMLVVDPGVYQDRRGLLFGPFSPIYGIGAVLMTVALNRFKNANLIITFIVCTIIGGAFEYAVSWWLEVSYGVIAWDYHGQFLGDLLGGRTCLLFASMFGLLGMWWIKWALPRLLAFINLIPWKVRYSVTAVCAFLMVINIGMTLCALDCWQERVNGQPVVTPMQQFYADNFDNAEMQDRFQSMTITPKK